MLNSKDSSRNGAVQNQNDGEHIHDKRTVAKDNAAPRVSFSENAEMSVSIPSVNPLPRPSLVEMYTSKRWGITFLSLTVITFSMTLRMCMSMAIVCMVKPLNTNASHVINTNQSNTTYVAIDQDKWSVDWDIATQGQVLSSYYYGFPVLCVFGGWAAGKYSGKIVLLVMMTTLSVASMGIPYAAITSPYLVMVLRIIVGLASGGTTPCIMQILSKWAPLYERSQIIATAASGQILGNVLTFAASGLICTIPFQNGWPLIFYIFGVLNLLIMVVWTKVIYDHPEDHPRMTKSEINYISKGRRDSANIKMPNPPWLKILTSAPFWAIMSAHISFGFIFTTLGTFLPLYMNDIMKFETSLNGIVSSVPFIGRLLGTMTSGYIADMCYTKGWLSTRGIRITFQTIGTIGSAPFLFGLSYLDDRQKELAVCLLILYWFIQGAVSSGFRANHLDIAPRFAGVINGMTMTCGSLSAIASPLITSAILINRTQDEWQVVFMICVGVGIVGTILFDCFVQGEEQTWAQDKEIDVVIDVQTTPSKPCHHMTVKAESRDHQTCSTKSETHMNGKVNPTFQQSDDELNDNSQSVMHNLDNGGTENEHEIKSERNYINRRFYSCNENEFETNIEHSLKMKNIPKGTDFRVLSKRKPLRLYIPSREYIHVTENTRL